MIGPKLLKPSPVEVRRAYELVTLRDADTCQRCLRDCGQGVTSRDHRKGRGVGGVTAASNLQILGGTGTSGCHGWKTANPVAAMSGGWSVPGWADSLVWPARRWIVTPLGWYLGWAVYGDSGSWDEIGYPEAMRRMKGMAA